MDNNEVTENITLHKLEVIGGLVFTAGLCLLTGRFFEHIAIPYGIGSIVSSIGMFISFLGVKKRISSD